MRCCRKISLLLALAAFWFALAASAIVHANGIEVRKASLTIADDGYVLEANFGIALTPPLEEALNKGVSLYFLLEFELIRARWYWFNEKIADLRQQYRLSYNALTRQYRVGVGALYQNFNSLPEALEVMSRVRRREEVEPGTLKKDSNYIAALRLRLDITQLPKPFQISALGSREWNIGSDWHRWVVGP
ncbi:MAG: DUF4390 domain-containing protein [Burkholderiales bacterium]